MQHPKHPPKGPWLRLAAALPALAACARPLPPEAAAAPPTAARLADEAEAAELDEKVEALLAKMTLSEKLGQLNQRCGGSSQALNSLIDDAECALVRQGRVGSYLHVAGAEFLKKLQRVATEESRLGIPLLFGLDVVHGYRTIFPVPLAAACSWDPEAVQQAARAAAREATAAGLHWTFAPMVDIARDPRWGRIVEGAGEDPYLGAVMAAAQVRGYQGEGLADPQTLLACAKHFVAYGAGVGGRDYNSAEIGPRTLAEVYLPPFRAAVQAGAGSVMSAFNDVAGLPMTAHRDLLTDLLREAWGFPGLVVSDWNAVAELQNHGVAADRTEAARLALAAGVDMDMVSGSFERELGPLAKSGELPVGLVDEAVRRVLRAKYALGLFQDPNRYGDPEREKSEFLSPGHVAFARKLAAKSIVLLKNEAGVLPLRKDLRRLAVIGPLADDARAQLGSWKAQGLPQDVVTPLAGVRAAVAQSTEVSYAKGCEVGGVDTGSLAEAERVARDAEAVLLVVGEDADMSGEARSRADLGLPGVQLELVQRVIAVGKPTAVVLVGGRPLAVPWLGEHAPALVQAWLLGVQAGSAIADVLFGDVNPGGKLVATLPRATGQVSIYYGHRNTGRPAAADLTQDTTRYQDLPITPLFPFGHGLSYTSFCYRDLHIRPTRVREGGRIEVSCEVANDGPRVGDEVVQLYVTDPVASVARPVLELKAFQRVTIPAQARVTVTFEVPVELLGFYDQDMSYVVEPGSVRLGVGSSSADIRLRGSLEVVEEIRDPGEPGTVFSRASVRRQAD
jgi:beta-glucosidase